MGLFTKLFNSDKSKTTSQLPINISSTELEYNDATLHSLNTIFIAIDVETTGLDPNNDRIIEIGAVKFMNSQITDTYGSLVNAHCFIPPSVTAINNITNEMIKFSPGEEKVLTDFCSFLGEAIHGKIVLCGYNAKFDIKFLSKALQKNGYPANLQYVDVYRFAKSILPGLENYKQDTVATRLGISNHQSHRATSDAETCGKILVELLKKQDKPQQIQSSVASYYQTEFTSDELIVCAFIQNCIKFVQGNTDWIRFRKDSSNYVNVIYFSDLAKFKFSKKGNYFVVKKAAQPDIALRTSPCTKSEGGDKNVRIYFEKFSDLNLLSCFFVNQYTACLDSEKDYFAYTRATTQKAKEDFSHLHSLSDIETKSLLKLAKSIEK